MKTTRTNISNNSPSINTNTIESQARTRHSKAGKIAAKVAKLFQPCLPILGVGKKTRMVLEKTPAVPPQTKTTLAELLGWSIPSSPRGSSVNQMAEEIGEGLRREIASKLAEKEIVQVDEVKAHFTAARTSKWGNNNQKQIEQWVEDLLVTTNIDTPPPHNTVEHKVDTWIAQQLEAPIAAKKAELIAAGTPGGQALLDDGFKKTLLDTLLQTNADPELEDEDENKDLEAYLMNKVETVLAQTEHPSFSLQLATGETVTLPGAYMKTKSADWHTSDLPKLMTELMTELKNALAKETAQIRQNAPPQDWEDVLLSQNLQARLEAYVTQEKPQELALHCPELLQTLIQQTLGAPENYTAHFITQEKHMLTANGEHFKAQGKDWRTKDFPELANKLEKALNSKIDEWKKKLKEPPAAWENQVKNRTPELANKPEKALNGKIDERKEEFQDPRAPWENQVKQALFRIAKNRTTEFPALGADFHTKLVEYKINQLKTWTPGLKPNTPSVQNEHQIIKNNSKDTTAATTAALASVPAQPAPPANYTTCFTTREGDQIMARGEDTNTQGQALSEKDFHALAHKFEEAVNRTIDEFKKNFRAPRSLWESSLRLALNQIVHNRTTQFSSLGTDFTTTLLSNKIRRFNTEVLAQKANTPSTQNQVVTNPAPQRLRTVEYTTQYGTKLTTQAANKLPLYALVKLIEAEILEEKIARFTRGDSWTKDALLPSILRSLENKNPEQIAQHRAFVTDFLLDTLKHEPEHYELFSEKNPNSRTETPLGGHFKKNPSGKKQILEHSLVRGANGHIYKLLNTLNADDENALHLQHQQSKQGKVVLGKGTFGTVRLAQRLDIGDTGEIVAVKKLRSTNDTTASYRKTIRDIRPEADQEIQQMQMIQERIKALTIPETEKQALSNLFAIPEDHAHIPKVSLTREDHQFIATQVLANKSYIFSPLANLGDGESALNRLSTLRTTNHEEANRSFLHIAKSYAKTVVHLHQLKIHHRDIKPENFLHSNIEQLVTLDDGRTEKRVIEQIQLADFGLAQDDQEASKIGGGTLMFVPPEFLTQQAFDARKQDDFSLGMTLQRMKQGLSAKGIDQTLKFTLRDQDGSTRPFELTLRSVFNPIYGRIKIYPGVPESELTNLDMSHMDNIIAKLIAHDPTDRISAAEALSYIEALDPKQDHLA